MVPRAGLEPAQRERRGILNPLCLPIPPPGQRNHAMVTPSLIGLRRENEAYFNGLRFKVNRNFVFFIQPVKIQTPRYNWRSFCTKDARHVCFLKRTKNNIKCSVLAKPC